MFEEDEGLDTSVFSDTHTMAAVLKQWLRQLPEPLLTFRLYDSIVQSAKILDPARREEAVQKIIMALPEANYRIWKYLCKFFSRVCSFPENRMSPSNVAIVFAPNVVRSESESMLTYSRDAASWFRFVEGSIDLSNKGKL